MAYEIELNRSRRNGKGSKLQHFCRGRSRIRLPTRFARDHHASAARYTAVSVSASDAAHGHPARHKLPAPAFG